MSKIKLSSEMLMKAAQHAAERGMTLEEYIEEFARLLEDKIKFKETITKGFENAPQALRDVLSGKNFGKQIIEI